MKYTKYEKPSAIEELIFKVKPAMVEKFIELDYKIWTKGLEKYKGFESKEVWVSNTNVGEITQVIYWSDYDLWKSIPQEDLDLLQKNFDEEIGLENYEFIGAPHEVNQKYRVADYK